MATDTSRGLIELPALFSAADTSSTNAQRRHLRLAIGQLVLLAGASLTSVFTWKSGDISYAALLGAVAIVFAGVFRVQLQMTNPSKSWYQGRAAAESVKTLSWRYTVAGDPFPAELTEAAADKIFVERLRDVLVDMDRLTVTIGGEGEEITEWMRNVRGAPLAERKQDYAQGPHRRPTYLVFDQGGMEHAPRPAMGLGDAAVRGLCRDPGAAQGHRNHRP